MSNSLWPHGLQHARLPCLSPSPRACSNSCPLSQWCHPTISSSVSPFSCLQSFPASVFSNESAVCIRWPKCWSFNFSISPSNDYSGLISIRINWFDLLAVQRTQESSPTPWLKSINSSAFIFPYGPTLTSIHDYWKNHSFDCVGLCRQSNVPVFNTLPRFVIAFLPRNKCLLISWLQSPSAVILEPKKIKSVTVSIVSPSICHEVMGPDAMIFIF